MDAYFARQPILDRNLKLFGYELLFRPNPKAEGSGDLSLVDGDLATASVLDAASVNGIEKVTGGSYAFINFTKRLLLDGIATLYPKKYLAVEVLESVNVDSEVLHALKELKLAGYLIVLDDYIYNEGDEELLALSDIVKVEVDGGETAFANLQILAEKVDRSKCQLLAEKVETQEIFDRAAALGCSLFQGYFFAKPKTMTHKVLSPLKINKLRLLGEVTKPEIDFEVIAGIVKSDVGLSYKTLQLANSVYYGARNKIDTINQAVIYLGKNELRKWIAFTSLSDLCDHKPPELIVMSMTRAYFCELVAKRIDNRADAEAYFLAGLFSLLEAITDIPLESCLAVMTLPPVSVTALLEVENPGRYSLDLIAAIENGEWEDINRLAALLHLEEPAVTDMYMEALSWAERFS